MGIVLMTRLARTPSSAFGTFSHRGEAATGEGYLVVDLARWFVWVAFSPSQLHRDGEKVPQADEPPEVKSQGLTSL